MAKADDDPTTPPRVQWFKSAEQLQIPPKLRDAVTSVLAMLERKELVYAPDENPITHGINMGNPARDLAHWLCSSYGEKLPRELEALIHPPAELIPQPESLTVPEIIAAIKSYLSEGVVRWRGVAIVAAAGVFKTGAPGRPSAAEAVLAEAKRRIRDGEVIPKRGGLTEFSEQLESWWKTERHKYNPPAPRIGASATRNAGVRDLWNNALRDA